MNLLSRWVSDSWDLDEGKTGREERERDDESLSSSSQRTERNHYWIASSQSDESFIRSHKKKWR